MIASGLVVALPLAAPSNERSWPTASSLAACSFGWTSAQALRRRSSTLWASGFSTSPSDTISFHLASSRKCPWISGWAAMTTGGRLPPQLRLYHGGDPAQQLQQLCLAHGLRPIAEGLGARRPRRPGHVRFVVIALT